jgi:hypothetical protein
MMLEDAGRLQTNLAAYKPFAVFQSFAQPAIDGKASGKAEHCVGFGPLPMDSYKAINLPSDVVHNSG